MPDVIIHNEDELLLQISQGDQEAFTQLFDRYFPKVFNHALTFAKSAAVAEEITQDIFLKLWSQKTKLPTINSFADYLFILTKNEVISAMRKRINQPVKTFDIELLEDTTRGEHQYDSDKAEIILKAIEKLPPQQKLVFTLKRLDNLSYEEIATQLGISKNTVKFHLVSALNFLRIHLANKLLFVILKIFL